MNKKHQIESSSVKNTIESLPPVVETAFSNYPDSVQSIPLQARFEDNRALVLTQPVDDTSAELKHCISQALRYNID